MPVAPSRAMAILIVDDDVDIREALRFVLAEAGYETDAVEDGLDALALLRSGERPALILLDLMMPRMDGWQFRERQLSDPSLAPVPVAVMSACGVDDRTWQLGIVDYVPKPIDRDALLRLAHRYSPNASFAPAPSSTASAPSSAAA